MAQTIQIKRGLESGRLGVTPLAGELLWTTDPGTGKLYMGDGTTAGGIDFITIAQGAYVPLTQKGAIDGVATLGADQKIPLVQLKVIDDTGTASDTTYSSDKINTLMTAGVSYRGHWDASTNTPSLNDSAGTNGYYYINTTVGTIDLGSGAVTYAVGDVVIYTDPDGTGGNPGVWEKSINSNEVQEVNGHTGIVELDGSDIDLTGYVIPGASGSLTALDSVNVAFGKLEKGLENAVAGGGDVNVQSNWDEGDAGSDAYILNKPVTITVQQAADITANNDKITYPAADSSKLSGIAAGAEVNVNADWSAGSGDAQILNKPTLVTEFSDLSDAGVYGAGEANKVVAVNATGDGLVYTTVGGGGISMNWVDLSDTPGSMGAGTEGKGTRINDTGTAIEYVDRELATQDDVNIGTLVTNDYLSWDGTEWINKAPETVAIDELNDVDTTTVAPSTNDTLRWDGTNWVPGNPIAGVDGTFVGLTDTDAVYTNLSTSTNVLVQVNATNDGLEYVDASTVDGGSF